MQFGEDGFFQLTYCTNIHPGNGWEEVFDNLRRYGPALKAAIAPNAPFGLGLRVSSQESCELLQGDKLDRFKDFLDSEGLYVFLLNGFPYGPFHKEPVKEAVFAPDWRDDERVAYTLRLVEILTRLLPDGPEGGISTSPLSYKPWVDSSDAASWEALTANIVRVAAALIRVNEQRGKRIHLDIEPEPDGLVENSGELARFYEQWLLEAGARQLAGLLGVSPEKARDQLRQHVQVCWDTCHMSVSYEEPAAVLDRYDRVGIQVGRVQVSAALEVPFPPEADRPALQRALAPFAESVYLHQVGQRNRDDSVRRYPDLPAALPRVLDPEAAEWRTHFHVPIFVEQYGDFRSTQDDIRRVFELLRQRRFTRNLEIETYTWDVLPPGLKRDLADSIRREYEWVCHVFA